MGGKTIHRTTIGYAATVAFCSVFAVLCLVPFFLAVMGSVTAERELLRNGMRLFPSDFSLEAYRTLFANGERVISGYRVTLIVTSLGTILSLLVNSLFGYALSRKHFEIRNVLAMFVFITMVFNGGMVSWYITMVRTLGLRNNIWGLIVPYLANAWNLLLLRNFFKSIPDSLAESAYIDGAGEFRIFFQIALPLSKPAIATIALFTSLLFWNDWRLGIFLIDSADLQPLQLMLRSIVSNIQFLRSSDATAIGTGSGIDLLPAEGVKLATMVVTIGPIILLYPFLQRYFIKGIMIGAIKG